MTGEWAWGLIIGFLISFTSAVWVNADAEALEIGAPHRGLWVVIVFLFPILGLLLYYAIGRRQAWNPREPMLDRVPETKTCKFCRRTLASDAIWCDTCGRSLQ